MSERNALPPVSRRRFLRHTLSAGGALAFPSIVPASVFGAQAPSNRVHLAALGVGGRGRDVAEGFLQLPDARYVAVYDPFRSRRDAAASRFNEVYGGQVARAHDDYREVLDRTDVDAVVVCTPDHWHVPLALAAARAGKDMYVEKPLGVSMAWAWRLRDAVHRHGNVFQYGTQQRSSRQFRQACELVRNGAIGTLERIDAWCPDISEQFLQFQVEQYGSTRPAVVPESLDYESWIGPAPMSPYTVDRCTCYGAWHTYDYALGFIAGWGAHPLDIAQWGNDSDRSGPVLYEGTGVVPSKGLYDTVSSWDIHCRYANGVALHFMGHRTAERVVSAYRPWVTHGTTFFGSEGWVSVDRGGLHVSRENLRRVTFGPDGRHLRASPRHDQDFVASVKSRDETVSPLEAAIRSDTISHLSDIVIRTGRSLRWDPQREEIVGDPVASRMLSRPLRSAYGL